MASGNVPIHRRSSAPRVSELSGDVHASQPRFDGVGPAAGGD